MGEEWWGKGTHFFEGPGLNVMRIPQNGRTFEYMSGEDPVIGKFLGPPLVKGVQQNVMAVAKHYMLNNQETDRSGGNMIVDEKTMMELYAPPFEAVAPHTASYMCAYNRKNIFSGLTSSMCMTWLLGSSAITLTTHCFM